MAHTKDRPIEKAPPARSAFPGISAAEAAAAYAAQMKRNVEIRDQATRPLRLIDLRRFGLQRLGVTRRELIGSDPASYPVTRAWAAALYQAVEDADGMIWVARQHDSSARISR
ncbi:MAG TPA: hypothetical protein VFP80_08355 [Thermoanaerobaculia bacterium]|nr:hypothetical protein [Thermoanaerobaculia bacterium]